jgi:acetyl-CoA carboxylase biotin carboxyl carrier protein
MSGAEPNSGDVFDLDKISRLVELMKVHDLAEINLKQGEQQIQLKRGGPAPQSAGVVPDAAVASPPPQSPAPLAVAPPPLPKETDQAEEQNIVYIKSPMVGTFYARPNPDADLFVRVGDHIEPDTTVCIIEAMKVFNEIAAEVSGQVMAILVENEEPVEYGKPLFKIDTSK